MAEQTQTQRQIYKEFLDKFQKEFINTLQAKETKEKFLFDNWERHDKKGTGLTIVLQDGNFFEKAGVNTTQMEIQLSKQMASTIIERGNTSFDQSRLEEYNLYANGVSLVIHPVNPFVPTTHANFRYIEIVDSKNNEVIESWFGGGADLTPNYIFEEDCVKFHQYQKEACDKHDPTLYPKLKKQCDEYFYIKHRQEHRGIGGTFYDDFKIDNNWEKTLAFVKDLAYGMFRAYKEIIEKRQDTPYENKHMEWKKIRRGRYVEFNLAYDRGTKFGFNTPNARIESILMSLPLDVRWEYMNKPEPGSEEEKLLKIVQNPREWV